MRPYPYEYMNLRAVIVLLMLWLVHAASGYTTWDGKAVPPMADPVNPVICSTFVQLYMAVRTQVPGRVIVLKPGTYDIAAVAPLRLDSPNVTIRGLSDDPSAAALVGGGFENCANLEEELINLYTRNTTIANLTITECRCNALKFQGGVNDQTVLHNVRFLNVGERMIKGPGTTNAAQCSIRYCHFEDTKVPSATRCGSDATDSDGNYIAGMDIMHATAWVVHDCVFRNIRGSSGGGRGGIFFWGGSPGNANTDMIVERNTFIGCDRAISYGNPSGTNCVNGGFIRNNFIVRGAGIGIEMENSTNIKIYNNTLYSTDPTYSRAVYFSNNFTGNEFRNNIIFGNISGSVTTISNNLSRTSSSDATTNWFVNRTKADLHLTSNATAAINSGAPGLVSGDWDGHGRIDGQCDIGADEFNSVGVQDWGALSVGSDAGISVMPNPFNPTVVISVGINAVGAYCPPSLALGETGNTPLQAIIYNTNGRIIAGLVLHNGQATWDASAQPSGAYVVRAQIGAKNLTKVITLVK